MRKTAFVLTFLLVVLGLAWLGFGRGAAKGTRQSELSQPANWVPFSADVRISWAGSSKTVVGRFFRNAAGSDRLETGPPDEPDVRAISIRNVTRSRFLNYSPKLGWLSQPMVLPPGGWNPPRFRAGDPKTVRQVDKIEGYEVHVQMAVEGDVRMSAPALNFTPLVRQSAKDGQRWVLSNIKRGDQPPELFELPAGAEARELPTPAGIIWNGPGLPSACPTCPGSGKR